MMGDLYGMLIGGALFIGALLMAYFKGHGAGEDKTKLSQYEKTAEVIEKDRELQNEADKIEETISSRNKSDRSGLLHYATSDSGNGDASKEDSANT